eukprot:CAMPEP_0176410058 /NCGR_PEP_ID=MMETSP0127-20121128/2845_1 /TAXON_ID=938130 /ORGANISM="Platyophrya macrostoma, Strain WH" /LENGTH=350 /DNA_ID=CAMNT_0017789511 /DNA_START=60 /DNA_END=1112 /DNA_ORIENTATION=+
MQTSPPPEDVMVPYVRDPMIAKRVEPILFNIRDLCLRRGEGGLCELLAIFRKDRVGPEAFKSELAAFGVALTGAENELIFAAFRDDIGYLVVPRWLDALLSALPTLSTAAVARVFAQVPPVSILPVNPKRRDAKVVVAAPLQAMLQQYMPSRDVGCVFGHRPEAYTLSLLKDMLSCGKGSQPIAEQYVTLLNLRAFYAGWFCSLAGQVSDVDFAAAVENAWIGGGDATAVGASSIAHLSAGAAPADYDTSQQHQLGETACSSLVASALPHKTAFPEVREKIDCPSRVVGYQGHMASAQEHFGETFHRVEASLPPFNGRPPQNDSLYTYQDMTHSFVRQGNKANTHNFRFA